MKYNFNYESRGKFLCSLGIFLIIISILWFVGSWFIFDYGSSKYIETELVGYSNENIGSLQQLRLSISMDLLGRGNLPFIISLGLFGGGLISLTLGLILFEKKNDRFK